MLITIYMYQENSEKFENRCAARDTAIFFRDQNENFENKT